MLDGFAMNYLLDTNMVLIYTRESPMTRRIEQDLTLFDGTNDLFISVVTVAEIESLMLQRRYGEKKRESFRKLLSNLSIIDVNIQEIITRYAEIDAYSQGKHPTRTLPSSSRNMGKNDLWIAATSSHYELVLVTTDQDFSHLESSFLSLIRVDIEDYR